MKISDRIGIAIKALISDTPPQKIEEEEILANGRSLTDKKDIEDPTYKFAGIRHVRTTRKNQRLRNNVDFFRPEYDFPTIANAVQLDGILRRVVNLFVEQIMKNGFEYVSKNEQLQNHVIKRIKEIELLTGLALHEVIEQVSRQLVTYANAYLIKVRSNTKSRYGKRFRMYGKTMEPIVGLFVAEATTMEIGLNPDGNVVQYKQTVRGQESYYDERDVIHFAFNKIPGTLSGMSSLLSILDDVRALRKLEEEIEILGFQYSIPLYLYKVGNKDIPPAPGEVEAVSSEINSMPAYGMLVVPGHHTIEVPSNTNTPVDIMTFVNHFKKRIYAGLGVSPVAMGEVETSNRNTSEVLDASMQTVTKSYQQIIKHRTEIGLFGEFLLDGKFGNVNDEVEFNFPEIDLEQQIKFETNILSKWQNNLISLEEARNEMDYDKKLDEKRNFLNLIEIPKIQAQGAVDSQIAKAKAAVSNKVAPANQKGKSSGRPKYTRNTIETFQSDIINLVDSLSDTNGITDFNTQNLLENIISSFNIKATRQINENIKVLVRQFNLPNIEIDKTVISDYLNDSEKVLSNKISYFSKKSNDNLGSKILFNELNDFIDTQKVKLESVAKILIYKSLGFKTILIDADECNEHELFNLSVNALNYSHIPPFNYGCKCSINDESLYEFK